MKKRQSGSRSSLGAWCVYWRSVVWLLVGTSDTSACSLTHLLTGVQSTNQSAGLFNVPHTFHSVCVLSSALIWWNTAGRRNLSPDRRSPRWSSPWATCWLTTTKRCLHLPQWIVLILGFSLEPRLTVSVVLVRQRYLQLTENFMKDDQPAVVRSRAAGDQSDGQTDTNGQESIQIHLNSINKLRSDVQHPLWCLQEVPPLRWMLTCWKRSHRRQAPPTAPTSSPSLTSP